jgi:2-aminoethylphosphonate-pyruvate transaminase
MIQTAVILAAGLGSRLKEKTKLQPKGFLELENNSLIKRSIDNLLSCGIENIYIGTGYLSEVYEKFALDYSGITCIKSDQYKTTSSMYTLYNMKHKLKEDFLLLESDLLYEVDALRILLNDNINDIILSSGQTNSEDEVYIQTDKKQNLVKMSKQKENLTTVNSELVGISKISQNRFKMMCTAFENQNNPKIDYEYIMVQTAKLSPFNVKKIENLIWCEIDDENHLNRALNTILPKIKAKYEEN